MVNRTDLPTFYIEPYSTTNASLSSRYFSNNEIEIFMLILFLKKNFLFDSLLTYPVTGYF